MNTFIIALPSLNHLTLVDSLSRESDQGNIKYLQAPDFEISTLMRIERCIASACENKSILRNANPWDVVGKALQDQGFRSITEQEVPAEAPLFMYPKPWDEAWGSSSENSFFVTFPPSAPHELAGAMILATSYPAFFCDVITDFVGEGRVLLISPEHEAIYPDDKGYASPDEDAEIDIGCVILPEDQFISDHAYEKAHASLIKSGYLVF